MKGIALPFHLVSLLGNFQTGRLRRYILIGGLVTIHRYSTVFQDLACQVADLLQHPEIRDDFLAPFKSQGVYSVDDSALVIRAKFTAKPGRQFLIRREAYAAVQRAFAENGIRFADRRVTVAVPGSESMTPEQRAQAERAAASALADDQARDGTAGVEAPHAAD